MMSRLLALLRPGRVTLLDDSGGVRLLQVDEGPLPDGRRVINDVPNVQHFGHAGSPPIGSEAVLASPGGDRSHTIVIGTNHKPSRPRNLKPGDSCQYDVRGQVVKMTEDGLLIDCAGFPAVIRNFSSLTVEGDIHVTGDVLSRSSGAAVSLNGLRDAYDAHKHPVTALGSTTGPTDHSV